MPINIEKYRKHLARYKLDKEYEDEIIHNICKIMDEFVLAARSKHPAQQALQDRKQKTLQRYGGMIDSDNRTVKLSFKNTASGQD